MGLTISSNPQFYSNLLTSNYNDSSAHDTDYVSTYQQDTSSEDESIVSIYQQNTSSEDESILSYYQQNSTDGSAGSLLELTQDLEAGAEAQVTEGSVTLANAEGTKSLAIAPEDSVAVMESGEDGMIIHNQTTGEAVSFSLGETVEASGDGQFELLDSSTDTYLGGEQRLRLEGGETAELTNTGEGLELTESNFTEEISVESATSISTTGATGEQLSLATESGQSLSFNPGDEAEVTRTDSGLQFENTTTGETLTADSAEAITASGEAELSLGGSLEVEGGDQLEATVDSTEATLENRTITESVEVAPGDTESSSSFYDLQTYSSPQNAQISLFGRLVSELL